MSDPGEQTALVKEQESAFERVANLLGGPRVLKREVHTPLDAHELLLKGLPGKALLHLIDRLQLLPKADLENTLGMSVRTVQRRRAEPAKALNPEQSNKTWKFAEVLARATEEFGSQEEAEQWLERPAMGLDQRRPIDLMKTPAGVELVEQFLERLRYGVYL